MNRPSLVVLDVGHGSAAVVLDRGGVVVVDTGKGGVLLDFLREMNVKEVEAMLISHADSDHIRNAPDLLLDEEIVVKRICYNSDVTKDTQIWDLFRIAIRNARRKKGLIAEPQLTTAQNGRLDAGDVRIEVLYPFPETAASGPGGTDLEGTALTSNSMSAVIRLSTTKAKVPMVLLAGDAEQNCLRAWDEEETDPSASVLIFPHHGGNPGGEDPVAFAVALTQAVRPSTVIFSIHRSQYELPVPEIVEAVRRQILGVRVACTQLSTHCSADTPGGLGEHLTRYVANGKRSNSCCAGTMVIDLTGEEPLLLPHVDRHLVFIGGLSGSPLCTRKLT